MKSQSQVFKEAAELIFDKDADYSNGICNAINLTNTSYEAQNDCKNLLKDYFCENRNRDIGYWFARDAEFNLFGVLGNPEVEEQIKEMRIMACLLLSEITKSKRKRTKK